MRSLSLRLTGRRAAGMAAAGALLVPVAAGPATADAATKKKNPVITSVRPLQAAVGDTITIRGRSFERGRNRNSVVFKRDGGRAVFVKASVGTTKLIKVQVPKRLEGAMLVRAGDPVESRFRLRVLGARLGKRFTATRLSPLIGPERPPAPPAPPKPPADGDCDGDRLTNSVDADDDNDLLADTLEASLKLDPCKGDSDGDGAEDGYEYRSARDLNDDESQEPNAFLPFPGKRPYPNPLDPADAATDFDGDALSLGEEEDLWKLTLAGGAPRDLERLTYSDGEQYSLSTRTGSGRRVPTQSAAGYGRHQEFLDWAGASGYGVVALQDPDADWFAPRRLYDIRDFDRSGGITATRTETVNNAEVTYYDLDNNGFLSDDERDEDADGLTNFQETRECLTRDFWDKLYSKETPYYRAFGGGTRLDDADSDGDGVRDGADDQDNDDLPNVMECSRNMASGRLFDDRETPPDPPNPLPRQGFVNPYNPCLPAYKARTCNGRPGLDNAWAPFNLQDKYYYVFN